VVRTKRKLRQPPRGSKKINLADYYNNFNKTLAVLLMRSLSSPARFVAQAVHIGAITLAQKDKRYLIVAIEPLTRD